MVKATLRLHNFLRTEISGDYVSPFLVDQEGNNGETIMGEWRERTRNDSNLTPVRRLGSNVAPRVVYNIRIVLQIISCLMQVPYWQVNYVNIERL